MSAFRFPSPEHPMPTFAYPPTRRLDHADDYHGQRVPDPYRWLEDVDAPETRAWVEAQNALTFAYLDGLPARAQLRQRLTELWDYPRAQAPVQRGGRYFQLRNSGLQNQDVLSVAERHDDAGRVLLDPNTLSTDGTVALTSWSVSDDGCWLAYATSRSGSDWLTWRVRDVASGADLADVIEWSKFSRAAWAPDGSGFYYARYDAPAEGQAYEDVNYHQKLYFHRRGTAQADDRLVYARPDHKEWGFAPQVSHDGRYLVLSVWQGTDIRNRLFYRDLTVDSPWVELIDTLEATYEFIGNDGPVFYLSTTLDAPRGRLIAVDVTVPARDQWRTLIPEGPDVLEAVYLIHNQFVGQYVHDAHHQLRVFGLDGAPAGAIALPGLGSLFTFGDDPAVTGGRDDDELFFAFQSFAHPVTVYRYDFWAGEGEPIFVPPIRFDFAPYETRQVFVTSRDGTRVPLFLTHKRGLALDGANPTLLYGYGGFNLSILPTFAVGRLAWLELGGVFAVANLRGGGEYGEAWHAAGTLDRKQNVFDDLQACAEYLIAEKITSTPRLAIEGRSNGGLLVGACLTQRPDLFGAALAHVGVMDMLRFHKFTIGWAWVSDYGSADDPAQFPALYAYSPYHNLRPGTRYPATLVTTGDHDDRVVPGHSFKFAAALQAAQAGDAPCLIRIQTQAGHGFGKPTAVLIQEQADIYAFLAEALGVPVARPDEPAAA